MRLSPLFYQPLLLCLLLLSCLSSVFALDENAKIFIDRRNKAVRVIDIKKLDVETNVLSYRLLLTSIAKEIDLKGTVEGGKLSHIVYKGDVGFDKDNLDLDEWTFETAFQALFEAGSRYDAVNIIGREGLSYGILQSQHESKSFLTSFMSVLKDIYPAIYEQYFESRGIFVENEDGFDILSLITDEGGILEEEQAWEYMGKNVRIVGSFIEAAHVKEVQIIQRHLLHKQLITPMLQLSFPFKGEYYIWDEVLKKDERLLAVMLVALVSMGLEYTEVLFEQALHRMVNVYNTPDEVNPDLYLRYLRLETKDKQLRDRVNLILDMKVANK